MGSDTSTPYFISYMKSSLKLCDVFKNALLA